MLRERTRGQSYYGTAAEWRAWGNARVGNEHPWMHLKLAQMYETFPRNEDKEKRLDFLKESDSVVPDILRNDDIEIDGVTFKQLSMSHAFIPQEKGDMKRFYFMTKRDQPKIGSDAPILDTFGVMRAEGNKDLTFTFEDYQIKGKGKREENSEISRQRERGRDRQRSVFSKPEARTNRKASRSRSRSRGSNKKGSRVT